MSITGPPHSHQEMNVLHEHTQPLQYSNPHLPYLEFDMGPMADTAPPRMPSEAKAPNFSLDCLFSNDDLLLDSDILSNATSTLDPSLASADAVGMAMSMKQLTITTCCTSAELQRLMQMTVDTLDSVRLGIDSQKRLPASKKGCSKDSRQVTITASCSAVELGKLTHLAAETLSEVNFAVATAQAQAEIYG
ncbi:MAG: hypothetical protein Q9214_001928 [Letrouitia sp. 1 TL-2023]